MKNVVYCIAFLIIASCNNRKINSITNPSDYETYLVSSPTETTSKYFELWNSKIKPDSVQLLSFPNVAGEYSRFFKKTGDIKYLRKAEKALVKAVEIANINKAAYRRALSRNYISQHRFKEALALAEEAAELGGGKKNTQSLLFDVHMELGNYDQAEKYLDSIKNMSDFGYLIRIAKWNDYKGNLDTTIHFMEKAMAKAESSKNKTLLLWSYSNIADYYGHAGRIQDSYTYYLKTLELDSENAYAKKGIAWIVFSHEKNGKEALRILDAVTENYNAPDYYLFKAEISAYKNDKIGVTSNMDKYYSTIQRDSYAYGDMYNAYDIEFYLNHTQQYDKALNIALKEVVHRPTAEAYGLLANVYHKMGKSKVALELVEKHIVGKTFEPAILLQAAKVYKANNQMNKVAELKLELKGAVYELGPASEKEIEQL
ncbi:tetratricopeptide repeat protein [uncultured Croceitalea sp.]|uniref:tetratricopeptide repeat protein n=1 Tax=uncultured Croceitalea sp. TaxID=1798908 RepID=UPI0033060BD4